MRALCARAKPLYRLTSWPRVAFVLVSGVHVTLYEERRWSAESGIIWRFILVLMRVTDTSFKGGEGGREGFETETDVSERPCG